MPPAKTTKPIGEYLTDLKNPSYKIRRDAVKNLRKTKNPAAIPYLIECLKDSTGAVRLHAIRGLGQFKDEPQVLAPLIQQFKHPACKIHRAAHEEVDKFGRVAIPMLVAALKDRNRYVRGHTIYRLKELSYRTGVIREAVDPVLETLHDPEAYVLWHAINIVESWKLSAARLGLQALIAREDLPSENDLTPDVLRRFAEGALASLPNPEQ